MVVTETFIESSLSKADIIFEMPLRPDNLKDFIGQEKVHDRLQLAMGAALQRGDQLGHTLFYGPPGLGKTTLSNIISKAMGTNMVSTSGAVLDKPGDLAGILTTLKRGDVLFIDEIHRLPRIVEEYLYPAMEDFNLDLVIDSGPSARSVQIKLEQFTLVGATTRAGSLSGPLRSRFGLMFRLDYYQPEDLKKVVMRSADILNIKLDTESALEVANRSRGTPRIANNLLRWVRDYAQMRNDNIVNKDVVHNSLEMLSIDECGLDEVDKKILKLIIDFHGGGPVGLSTIAAAIGEETITIEDMYEPYLIMNGFLRRTPRGREVTQLAYNHLEKINFKV